MDFDDFINGRPMRLPILGQLNSELVLDQQLSSNGTSDSSEEFDIAYIIDNKPKVKEVRKFFRNEMSFIRSEEEKMFDV